MSPRGKIIRTGARFGRLTVIEVWDTRRCAKSVCRCRCGVVREVSNGNLLSGNTKSCGCLRRELSRERMHEFRPKQHGRKNPAFKHGFAVPGKVRAEYRIWLNMHARCLNPRNDEFKDYGGRGIGIFSAWCPPRSGFRAFLAYLKSSIGLRPPNPAGWKSRQPYYTLDRIDNDANYEPTNLRWATPAQQRANQRDAKPKKEEKP